MPQLVTGGSRGIGRATSKALADTGFDVAIISLEPPAEAADCIAEIEAVGRTAMYVQRSIADIDAHAAPVEEICNRLSRSIASSTMQRSLRCGAGTVTPAGSGSCCPLQINTQADEVHALIFAKREQSLIPGDNCLGATGERAFQDAIIRFVLEYVQSSPRLG